MTRLPQGWCRTQTMRVAQENPLGAAEMHQEPVQCTAEDELLVGGIESNGASLFASLDQRHR